MPNLQLQHTPQLSSGTVCKVHSTMQLHSGRAQAGQNRSRASCKPSFKPFGVHPPACRPLFAQAQKQDSESNSSTSLLDKIGLGDTLGPIGLTIGGSSKKVRAPACGTRLSISLQRTRLALHAQCVLRSNHCLQGALWGLVLYVTHRDAKDGWPALACPHDGMDGLAHSHRRRPNPP